MTNQRIVIAEEDINIGKVSHFRLRGAGKDVLTVICYEAGITAYVWNADGNYILADIDLEENRADFHRTSPGWSEMIQELECTSDNLKETIIICMTKAIRDFKKDEKLELPL